ncbi:MAG: hypothetical protein RL693_1879 [Verrucomicrobiota bacterium]|jgi:ankyrin repeat protein
MRKLNDYLKAALGRGELEECRNLIAEGAGSPEDLSPCDQATWLISAIKAPGHSLELLDLLLSVGFDPNSVYDAIGKEYQCTPVIAAVKTGRLDILKRLVAAGADLHWRSPTGANASSAALASLSIQEPNPDTPELASVRAWLSQQGVAIDPHCKNSRRKLNWAASNPQSWPEITVLLQLGIDATLLEWTPFMMKLATDTVTVEDVNAMPQEEIEHRDGYDRTPFLLAVAAGQREFAETLLNRGSDLFASCWCGDTALHLAARYDHVDLIDWLISLGMSVEIQDENHETPLRDAVAFSRPAATRRLLESGANPNAIDKIGFRVMHEANSQEILDLLLKAGADVNDISVGGDWPLKDACRSGDPECIRFLLNQGANPDLTSTGETALFYAVLSDSLECVTILLDAGAKINVEDCDGWTCLWCVRTLPMAQLLLDRGADPSISDQCDRFPEEGLVPRSVARLFQEVRLCKER